MALVALDSPILKFKDFRWLLMTRWLVTMALQVQAVIVGWEIYQIKQDALLLGMIGLAEAVPAICCAFFAGHFVDNNRPAWIYRLSLTVVALNSFFILSSISPNLHDSENLRLFILFNGVFISGAARSFASPSVFALIPQIVPRTAFASASAFNSAMYTFASIAGPALGGLVYGFAGPLWAFALPCFFAVSALGVSGLLSPLVLQYKGTSTREPVFKSIHAGMKFVLNHKVLLSTMALDMFSVLFGGAVAVLPIFADQIFKVGPQGLGVLRAAPAIGSVLVSLFFALRPFQVISGFRLSMVILGFGVSTILFGLTTNFYLALFFLAMSGVFDGVNMVIRGTLMQLLTPDQMRGRVSSLNSIFITSSNEIGAFESGVAARVMGLVPSVVFGGVMTLVVVAIVAGLVPQLNRTQIES